MAVRVRDPVEALPATAAPPENGGSIPDQGADTVRSWIPLVAESSAPEALAPDSDEGRIRLSQRVLQHLARRGGATPGAPSDESLTQRGIGAALGVTQGALSSVLGRLEDGGAIASDKAHVKGRDRRVKIYLLTPRGRELAARIPPNGSAKPPSRPPAPRAGAAPPQGP